MEYRCVIDKDKKYVDFVQYKDEKALHYTLKDGESLVDVKPPIKKMHALSSGFIIPMWKENAWVEGATEDEINDFNQKNPAPEPPAPQPTIKDLIKENELLKAQIKAQSERNDFMEDCIAEMAMQIYN